MGFYRNDQAQVADDLPRRRVSTESLKGSRGRTTQTTQIATLEGPYADPHALPAPQAAPTRLRTTGAGVGVVRIGASVGALVLAHTASIFGTLSAVATLAGLWSIGPLAPGIGRRAGSGHGVSLEALSRALTSLAR